MPRSFEQWQASKEEERKPTKEPKFRTLDIDVIIRDPREWTDEAVEAAVGHMAKVGGVK